MDNNYIPTMWIGGKTIGTADVMNNIENGLFNIFTNFNNHIQNHPSASELEYSTNEEIIDIFNLNV